MNTRFTTEQPEELSDLYLFFLSVKFFSLPKNFLWQGTDPYIVYCTNGLQERVDWQGCAHRSSWEVVRCCIIQQNVPELQIKHLCQIQDIKDAQQGSVELLLLLKQRAVATDFSLGSSAGTAGKISSQGGGCSTGTGHQMWWISVVGNFLGLPV